MEQNLKELVLLLLYLTSWDEEGTKRSWKGYPFEVLNKLEEEGFISQGRKSKSVFLTQKGLEFAKNSEENYLK